MPFFYTMALKDREIINCIRRGEDSRILGHLYDKVLPKIRRYICRNSGSEDDAFDIFQDGIIIFYKYVVAGRYRDDLEISGFLFTVCKNLWINKVKHDKMVIRLSDAHESSDNEKNILELIVSREREEEVKHMMKELGERCRELLQYVFYYQLTTREICEKMGFANENTLKTKKYKCKQRLLEIMNQSGN